MHTERKRYFDSKSNISAVGRRTYNSIDPFSISFCLLLFQVFPDDRHRQAFPKFHRKSKKRVKALIQPPNTTFGDFNTSTSTVKEAKCTQNFPALERNRANKDHTS